ncbi:hypothetical protein Ahy_B01g052547 [Arachis hypogaea]|uniref:Uncharacterized protein n=1 Tax=Arachis hypogaea TaxID=3818 RepID=A0A445APU5_ARAHY|nr:hypothetical protein Ahy_B01g052547 [Arachis hypogaea]
MKTSRGVADQPNGRGRGHGRGRVSAGTLENSGSSPSNSTTPVTSQIVGASEQPFIIVSNPNYVPASTVTPLPPFAQQSTVSATPPPATDTAVLESSHGSQPYDAPLPSPIVRLTIWFDGRMTFAPNNDACTQEMTNVIKLMYDHPWPSYKKISSETRDFFVQLLFIWDKEHDALIRKIYDHQMGRWLQQMLKDVRERRDHLTIWLCPKINKALYVQWETNEGFRYQRLTNKANRASARWSKYTPGSATFMNTKAKLLKLLDRDATLTETFKYIHTLKENKERFVD